MKIYLAGPLFTQAEIEYNEILAFELEGMGHTVWLPQEVSNGIDETSGSIFESDVQGLVWCDVVVAVLDGADFDSGTSWEIGWAWANKRPIYGLRTDIRRCGDDKNKQGNLMITQSLAKYFNNTRDFFTYFKERK